MILRHHQLLGKAIGLRTRGTPLHEPSAQAHHAPGAGLARAGEAVEAMLIIVVFLRGLYLATQPASITLARLGRTGSLDGAQLLVDALTRAQEIDICILHEYRHVVILGLHENIRLVGRPASEQGIQLLVAGLARVRRQALAQRLHRVSDVDPIIGKSQTVYLVKRIDHRPLGM